MKKRLSGLMLVGVMMLSLAACGGKNEEKSMADAPAASVSQEAVEVTESPEAVEVTPSPEPEKMTAKKLAEQMAAALEGKQILQTTAEMEMELVESMSIEGMSMEMEMSMHNVTDTVASMEPYAAYTFTSATTTLFGETTTVETEMYSVVENDSVVYYMNDVTTGTWSRLDIGMTLEEVLEMNTYTGYNWMLEKDEEELLLEEETQLLGGKEVYVLHCTLTGDENQKALSGMSGLEDMLAENGLGAIDYSLLTVPTVFYVDAQTFLPVKIDMDMQGMNEVMDNFLPSILEENGIEGMEDTELSIDVRKMKAVYSNISYDPVEVPAVPEEAYVEIAQADINPDQGDGTYIIQESGVAVRLTCPEDWTAMDMSYDSLTLMRNDGMQMVVYTMYQKVSNEDFLAYVEDEAIPRIQENEMYISHEAGPVIDDMETILIECTDMNMIYAWKPVGEGWVFINMLDYEWVPVEDALKLIVDTMEEWTLENIL